MKIVFRYNVFKYQGEKKWSPGTAGKSARVDNSHRPDIYPVSSPLSLIDDICAAFVTMLRLDSLSERIIVEVYEIIK